MGKVKDLKYCDILTGEGKELHLRKIEKELDIEAGSIRLCFPYWERLPDKEIKLIEKNKYELWEERKPVFYTLPSDE